MSQQSKRDIADFFRPYGKPVIPRKRPTPEVDDTPRKNSRSSSPLTPSLSQNSLQVPRDVGGQTPSRLEKPPLTTPKSGRSISIAIHSPAAIPPPKLASARKNRFPTKPTNYAHAASEPSSSFSFADAPTSSRSIVEDGKLIGVRDSDSDDSLEDLATLFNKKPKNPEGPRSSQTTSSIDNEKERRALLSQFTGGRSEPILKKEKLRELQRRQRAANEDLSYLFEDEKREARIQQSLAEADERLEKAKQDAEATEKAALDKRMLAAILQGDSPSHEPEDADRLLEALDRTEALTGERSFSFFGRLGPRDISRAKRAKKHFPTASIPHELWQPKDTVARNRAYQSGFITELASSAGLADDVVRWTFDAILTEEDETLRASYTDCIAASSAKWTRANVTPGDIQSTFEALGAVPTALAVGTSIESQPQSKRDMSQLRSRRYKYLLVALKQYHAICQDMDFATLSMLTSTTSKLCLDQEVMLDNQVCLAAQGLLHKLATLPGHESRDHVHQQLLSDIGSNLHEPALQAQLIQNIPATCTISAKLRTHMAARFLLGPLLVTQFNQPDPTTTRLSILTSFLTSHPVFTLDKQASHLDSSTSYLTLSALTTLLDASIANGHPPPDITTNPHTSSTFNAALDTLADHIHALHVSIADTGASHMRRTEAKDAIHSLHFRLVHAVRTEQRQKRHVFDNRGEIVVGKGGKVKKRAMFADALEMGQEEKGRGFMAKFLAKKRGVTKDEAWDEAVKKLKEGR